MIASESGGASGDTVVVTGAAGDVGARLVAALAGAPDVARVLALDARPQPPAPTPTVERRTVDLADDDLKPLLEAVDVVIHLPPDEGPDDRATANRNVEGTRRLLDAAGAAGVGHVVVLSSATVYGAWGANPVPLTEDAALRPNPGFTYAIEKAEVERLCGEWRDAHPGATVAVLRPAMVVGDDGLESWLARSVRAALLLRAGGDPAAQFLHVDDLVTAIDVARRARLDGPCNVAPDGWVDGAEVRALAGAPPRLPVPAAVAGRLASMTWRRRLGPTPPGVLPYTLRPWVVANDRLRAAGWHPAHSNEEAFVAAHRGTPWSRLSPQRRQELLLAAAGSTVAGVVALGVLLVRRARRRRRS